MLVPKKKPGSNTPYNVDLVNTVGDMEYTKDGKVYKHSAASSVMIASSSELSGLTGYEPGSIAFTAGFGNMWQLDASGQWISIV